MLFTISGIYGYEPGPIQWIFLNVFSNEDIWSSINISLKFVEKGQINNIPALVQIMAWRQPGDKPLSEVMMVSLLTRICVTRSQWVNSRNCVQQHRKLICSVDLLKYTKRISLLPSCADWNVWTTWPRSSSTSVTSTRSGLTARRICCRLRTSRSADSMSSRYGGHAGEEGRNASRTQFLMRSYHFEYYFIWFWIFCWWYCHQKNVIQNHVR